MEKETYERLALQLIYHAVKNNKLSICCDKPTTNLMFITEGGGGDIPFNEMLYKHKEYMDRLKNDEDSEIFLMLKE